MSDVSELAEREALLVEADLTEEESEQVRQAVEEGAELADVVAEVLAAREPEAVPPPPPPPSGPQTEKDVEKAFATLAREKTKFHGKVGAIMGPMVDGFTECAECGGVGLVPPAEPLQTHADFKACDTCAGHGVVRTGSTREGREVQDCPRCDGRGYLQRLTTAGAPNAHTAAAAPPLVPPPGQVADPNGANGANGADAADEWGVPTWMGDPTIGR